MSDQRCWNLGKRGFVSRPLADRFWEKVEKRGPDECWIWVGSADRFRRGHIAVQNRKVQAAHVAWEFANGTPFPKGMLALHSCDDPRCVNPAHIRPGTARENMQEMAARGRQRCGPRKPWSLTPEQRTELLSRRAQGATIRSIAKEHGVSRGRVRRLLQKELSNAAH